MNLEISGKLIQILPEQNGQGKNGVWRKQEFVIETQDQYPKKVCLNVWGDKIDMLAKCKEGEPIKVGFNLESREWNGKWYTDVKAWKIEKSADEDGMNQDNSYAQNATNKSAIPDEFSQLDDSSNDLPF